jgi:dTMP kinase
LFITFEGPEGSGKTTQLLRLKDKLESMGREVVATREPGGTAAGERIRSVLLDLEGGPLQPRSEAMLFCAARSELVSNVVRPALEAGRVVLCDRYADATLSYQGYGRGMPMDQLRSMNELATGGLDPHLTLLFDLPVEVGLGRRQRAGEGWNRFDAASLAFHQRVRDGYLALAALDPARWRIVDADQSAEAVEEVVTALVVEALASAGAPEDAGRV